MEIARVVNATAGSLENVSAITDSTSDVKRGRIPAMDLAGLVRLLTGVAKYAFLGTMTGLAAMAALSLVGVV